MVIVILVVLAFIVFGYLIVYRHKHAPFYYHLDSNTRIEIQHPSYPNIRFIFGDFSGYYDPYVTTKKLILMAMIKEMHVDDQVITDVQHLENKIRLMPESTCADILVQLRKKIDE